MEVGRALRLAATAVVLLLAPGCADHLRNPLAAVVREQMVFASVRVEMRSDGGPLRGLDTVDAAGLAARLEYAIERQFANRMAQQPGAVEMHVVVTSYGLANGAVALVGGQVAHHIDGRVALVRDGRPLATYPVNVYRETGNLGVVIGTIRRDDPADRLAEAFAGELYRRFVAP